MYSKAVLYSNLQLDTFVVDIPTSIQDSHAGGRLFSTAAVESPFLTPEPKGSKRDLIISTLAPQDLSYHIDIETRLRGAHGLVAAKFGAGPWCLSRVCSPSGNEFLFEAACDRKQPGPHLPLVLSAKQNIFSTVIEVQNDLVSNSAEIAYIVCGDSPTFLVPAKSCFIWSSVRTGLDVLRDLQPLPNFDMIIMDPPWANRSAKHAKTYRTIDQQQSDAYIDALTIVDRFHAKTGHVAVWITNKSSVRERALDTMAALSFVLIEEWIWVKVTSHGMPVTRLDGLWRKPYEMLLVFKHGGPAALPRRRVIFAVPERHSRKPNLKYLFDQIFRPKEVLEIFARGLTSGWWCLGDEVLKYQDVRHWEELPKTSNH